LFSSKVLLPDVKPAVPFFRVLSSPQTIARAGLSFLKVVVETSLHFSQKVSRFSLDSYVAVGLFLWLAFFLFSPAADKKFSFNKDTPTPLLFVALTTSPLSSPRPSREGPPSVTVVPPPPPLWVQKRKGIPSLAAFGTLSSWRLFFSPKRRAPGDGVEFPSFGDFRSFVLSCLEKEVASSTFWRFLS